MVLLFEKLTAGNIAGYYDAIEQDLTLGEKLFPTKKQLGLKLAFVKGASGKPVVLKPAAFDTKVPLRERMSLELNETNMPFFKEAILVKEQDRQDLNIYAQTGNSQLVDTVLKSIFDDSTNLINGAKARIEAMRMQVLATGMISFKANGVAQDYDYQVPESNKGKVKKAWTDAKATPLADIEGAIVALEAIGSKAEVIIMNSKTYNLLKNAASTLSVIKPTAPAGSGVTKKDLNTFLEEEYELKVIIKNETFVDDDGEVKKYYPDGFVTLAPNNSVGHTVFGTTPEESDLLAGANVNSKVEIVETGIAVTTTTLEDPVNVQTKVSMIVLPSFEQLHNVYMLQITTD